MNRHLKLLISASIGALFISGCSNEGDSAQTVNADASASNNQNYVADAHIANPSNFARTQEAVYFSYYDLGINTQDQKNATLAATDSGQAMRQQHIDSDGDGQKDGLQIYLDLAPAEKRHIEFSWNAELASQEWPKLTQAEISHKEGGEWVQHPDYEDKKAYVGGSFKNVTELTPPEYYTDHSNWIRYEGTGIESDKVGYRVYLDWRNGFDIFGKSVAEPVLQNVGQDGYESYHHLQDWGLDVLKVGSSLGAGGFGIWDGKKVQLVNDVESHTAKIIENGSSYSSFKTQYKNWKNFHSTVDLEALLAMNAGSRLVHARVTPSSKLPNFAIGLVKHADTDFIQGDIDIPGDAYSYIASWGKQSLNDDMLGMAVIFKKRYFKKILNDEKSYALQMDGSAGDLEYFFTAAWEGEHKAGIATKEAFVEYLNQEAQRLTRPVRIDLNTATSQQAKTKPITAEAALHWATRLADSELDRKTLKYTADGWDTNRKRIPKFEYDIIGLLPMAYYRLGEVTGNEDYLNVIDVVTASFIADDGSITAYKESNYNIDAVAPGIAVLQLYKNTKSEKYKIALDQLRHQLENQPRTSEGAFWHKQKYPSQLWLDGVFMGLPFLAEYSLLFEDGASYEEVVKEIKITRERLRDKETGLYYHAWDESVSADWANPETGLSKEFWSRGMGWLAMALVDVLDYIPAEETELRQPIIEMINEFAQDLLKYRDPETGTWWQVVDKPNQVGNYRESSGTAMFSYFFSKAVRLGYLSEEYLPHAQDIYESLISEFVLVHDNGQISMTNQCYVAGLGFGRDGSYDYYMDEMVFKNDAKGNVPFIRASVETHLLLKQEL